MADTDTQAHSGKPADRTAGEAAPKNPGGGNSSVNRAEAQADDPYRPAEGNDYALSIKPEDTGEATVANLFQAVPLEHEGSGASDQGGEGLGGDGGANGRSGLGGPGDGLRGRGTEDVTLPQGETGVVETSDGGPNDDNGLGDGDVPNARGLDANLSEFDLGGDGVGARGSQVGDGIGGGGGGGGGNTPLGPLSDADASENTVQENATAGTPVGIVAFADDPDAGDIVTYEIIGDSPFVIDPVTGLISVGPDADLDREEIESIDVVVQATSSDGSSVVGTFTISISDDNTEFTIGPVTDIDDDANFVQENAVGGTGIDVTAFAEDPDATDTVTYEILGDSPFVIDPETGVLTVADGAVIDREETPFIDVLVQATSTDGSTSSQTFRVQVGDENEFEIGPVTDEDDTANFVEENSDAGTVVGITAFAEDPDATDTVTYEIVGDSPFVINQFTGVITVAPGAVIDRETTEFIDVTVLATSTDGSTSQATFRVQIGDENEFEIGPVTDEDATANFVQENSSEGTVVGVTAFAEDPDATDTVSYEIVGTSPFVIDPTTGVITVAPGAVIDRETTEFIDVTVQATSTDGSTSQETFRVQVGDENEFIIGPVEDTDTTDNYVIENSGEGTVVNITAFAEDPDATDTVTYEIVGDSPFVIDPNSGVITVAAGADIDRETTPTIDVTVRATSTDGSTSENTFTVEVRDDNEYEIGPITDVDNTLNAVAENGAGGELVGITAFAEDLDQSDTVTYSTDDPRFDIDPDTGVLTVKSGVSFDFEATPTVDVEITATSSDGSSSTGTFTVDILDVNEAPDLIVEYGNDTDKNLIKNGSFETFDVARGDWDQFTEDSSGAWTSDGKMEVWDNYGGVTATEGDQHLELDAQGEVNSISQTVETSLGQVYDLSFDVRARTNDTSNTVEVYWNGDLVATVEPGFGAWETAEFKVVGTGGDDVLELRETSEDNNTYGALIDDVQLTGTDRIGVLEELQGAEVVPLSVIDPDVGDTHTFTVSDERFEVVAADGKYLLKLKDDQALDYETETQVTVEVTATDSGGLSDTETVVIDVIDVNENTAPIGPVVDTDNTTNFVEENSSGGTVVGVTAFATDPDSADTVTYEIVGNSPFEIDPTTGVITVADGAVIDREATEFIDVTVKASSTDGSSSSETFRVAIGDQDEFDIGPVSDIDTSANTISELAGENDPVGITAFAEDKDATDTVTYELTSTDDRFEIDENTGVITVADGAQFDAETEPSIDLTVKATSTDGSSSSKTFEIEVTDGNEAPDLIVHLEDGSRQFIVNGSFEIFDGPLGGSDGTGWYQNPNSIEGWSYNDVDVHQEGHLNFGATDGDHHLDLAALTNGWASQQIEGQLDGQVYELSFDMKSRGGVGQSVAEVYWNGELIDTIDPATTGTGWQTYTFNIVGGSGDGSNTLTFVEIGSDNNGGALIDSVSIVSDSRTAVLEEFLGAEVAPLSVIDPDVGDTHTFTVSDDRFEVVVSGDKYLLKLKDDLALDYETETQVTVDVTATDEGGLSDTETVVIDVIDIDEVNTPIGTLTDKDDSLNAVAENGAGGEIVGITAFADDPDAGDSVTYSTDDPRFDIDPDTGVLTVKNGVSFDYEATPTVDVEITATSSDGSSTTGTFTVDILDVNEAPDLLVDAEEVSGVSATLTFTSESAGYSNSVGVFYMDDSGNPVAGQIVWTDGNELTPGDTVSVAIPGVDANDIGYFLIPDGADLNPNMEAGDMVTFAQDGDGNWQAFAADGTPLTGQGANAFFSGDGSLNPDGYDQAVEAGVSIGFEDIAGGGDEDFNDFIFETDVVDTGYYRATVTEEVEGAEVAPVSVVDPDAGDTHSFTVSDNRFEVVVSGDAYMLKLKDDQALDYETETQVTVEVTATDSGGLSDTETVVIDVIDVIENTEPIGPVVDTDNTTNFVEENSSGGTVVGVTAFATDPDSADTVTYEIVGNSPFEIDPTTGVITVADGAVIDREATEFIDVTVKASSTDGSSSSETFRVAIGDQDEFDIGPVSDIDTSANTISELAGENDPVGITAFAEDKDATDTVTYELTSTDDRFEIDENTGVITVADGAQFDAETEPSIDLTVKATSTDGSSSSKTFEIEVTDGNEAPDLIVHLENGSRQFIVNGSFEVFDGPLGGSDGTGWYQNPNSIEGWSYNDVDVHQEGHLNFGATDGDHHLDLAALTNGWASQQIEGQLDGQVYELSFDMKSRGGVGQSVAEVYWNGELIDTIDPATTGTGWQTYTFNIVGGSGDGSNTLTFVEIGSDNNGGALIDSVSIVSDSRTAVLEEFLGAEVAPLSVIDPDVGDTHTFTVSDDRFEVVVSGDKYLLKLKDDQALDYETETQVTVDVTATDEGGLSDTETVVIDVIDIDEVNTPIGTLTDKDDSLNAVAENGAGGEIVGITAFADDPDAGDNVTYSTDDPRFDIDPDTGVLTVKNGVSFDYEATPTVDVEITATSSDGSSTTGTFTVDILDVNEAPDLDFDPELGPGVSVTMTFVEEGAGYSNVLGVFYMDGNGDPLGGEIVWVDQNLLTAGDSKTIYLEGVEADEIGYFLIPDGADVNSGLVSGDMVTFAKDGDGNWQAFAEDGTPLEGLGANVFFSGDGSLNPDGYDHTTEIGVTIGFEDLVNGGDEDFDDPVFTQSVFETNAEASVYEEELGAEVGVLTVADPDTGDTHTFTVSDDRFEVVMDGGEYVLKLKDDQALDYETETQVTVDVTATDSGGLSDTETIVIDVIDVEPEGPANSPVGPVRDTNTAQNLVAASAAAGAVVGLTAFAQDADAGDVVTYSIDDSRFDIDEDTGEVTVANGAVLTAGETIQVTITATSSDGTQSSAVFPIEVNDGGGNSAPDLIVGTALFEPPKSAGHLDDHHDDHWGHHHDGDTGQHDHDYDDKPHGHTDNEGGYYVPENGAGIELVELSVVDPDAGDTHTFTVSDNRFEVVADGDAYALKLKDGSAVDYETEQSITLDVTATDSGGLSDTETITLDVIDVKDTGPTYQYGTNLDDVLVGGDGADALYGRGGDDILIGQGGNDFISGGSGDDVLRGGAGDDRLIGDDGSDVFAYMLGDGNDTVFGGAGGSWIDIVDLADAADGTALGEYGADWSITMTEGTIENVDALNGDIELSQDAGGYIELADGGRVDFSDIEGIQY